MKRLVRYKLNEESKWLTFSGVMMGIAFFLQALDFFALRQLADISKLQLILFLVLPMVLEACWCVPLRTALKGRVEAFGILSALFCLMLLVQTVLTSGVFAMVMGIAFLLIAGAAAILITFGFFAHRALGILVFAAVAVMRMLIITIPQMVTDGYLTLVQELPPVCMILGMMLLYGGIRFEENDE